MPKHRLQEFFLCFKAGRVTVNELILENILQSLSENRVIQHYCNKTTRTGHEDQQKGKLTEPWLPKKQPMVSYGNVQLKRKNQNNKTTQTKLNNNKEIKPNKPKPFQEM